MHNHLYFKRTNYPIHAYTHTCIHTRNTHTSSAVGRIRNRCADRVTCDGYHDAKERRRRPDVYSYSSEPCPAVYDRELAIWYVNAPFFVCVLPSLQFAKAACLNALRPLE